jgi:hypothetical protein
LVLHFLQEMNKMLVLKSRCCENFSPLNLVQKFPRIPGIQGFQASDKYYLLQKKLGVYEPIEIIQQRIISPLKPYYDIKSLDYH